MYYHYYFIEASKITDLEVQKKYLIGSIAAKRALAKNPNISPEFQIRLFNFNNGKRQVSSIKESLATNPNLIPELQYKILQHGTYAARSYLGINENLIPEIFKELVYKVNILFYAKNSRLKYNNPATQALLEKYLLLV